MCRYKSVCVCKNVFKMGIVLSHSPAFQQQRESSKSDRERVTLFADASFSFVLLRFAIIREKRTPNLIKI